MRMFFSHHNKHNNLECIVQGAPLHGVCRWDLTYPSTLILRQASCNGDVHSEAQIVSHPTAW